MATKKIVFTIFFFFLIGAGSQCSAKLIDIVYTWVDHEDPVWQKAYAETRERYGLPATPESKVKSRFRNRDELKYSLRSIFAFAPWVHHIYIVTFGHRPSWLKPHSMITVVPHKDIFLNMNDLPTFNSQAIESNLHRIAKLEEYFIYFNDDVFLGKKVHASDFFSRRGHIRVIYDNGFTPRPPILPRDIGFVASWKNTNRLLDTHFGVQNRKFLAHAPFALRKSQMQRLEQKFPLVFQTVASHKFRSPEDYVMTCGLVQNFALQFGEVKEAEIDNRTIAFGSDLEVNRKKLKMLYDTQPATFCIEDIDNGDRDESGFQLRQFLQTYFPEKAPWEK